MNMISGIENKGATEYEILPIFQTPVIGKKQQEEKANFDFYIFKTLVSKHFFHQKF